MSIKPTIHIIDDNIDQEINRDLDSSDYKIAINDKRINLPSVLSRKADAAWKKFKSKNTRIARDNTTYFFSESEGKNLDYVFPEKFRYVQAFGKTGSFQKYNTNLLALSSLCLILTSDKKLVFGIKVNMDGKISGFSGYPLDIDANKNKIDIFAYLNRTMKKELNLESGHIEKISRIGKTYSPVILDDKGRLNNRAYNNVFLIKLNINSSKLKKNFKQSFEFKEIFTLGKKELLFFIEKNKNNFSIHCIGAIYIFLCKYRSRNMVDTFLNIFSNETIVRKKTIFITGASGFIGGYLSKKFNKDYNIVGMDIVDNNGIYFDKFYKNNITDKKTVKNIFNDNKIDYVIHAAAAKYLPWCEKNRDAAYKINYESSVNLYEESKRNNSKFIYISSDIVFDGKNKNSSEESQKHPINHYGTLKDLCEEYFLTDPEVAICRTAMVFGNIPKNQKKDFDKIKKKNHLVVQGYVLDHALYKLRNKEKIILPKDEFCNPTSNNLLYRQLRSVIENNLSGVLHCCGGERISRYDFGIKIAKQFNLDSSSIVHNSSNDILRPKDASMNSKKTQRMMKTKFDMVDEMIKQIIEEKDEDKN